MGWIHPPVSPADKAQRRDVEWRSRYQRIGRWVEEAQRPRQNRFQCECRRNSRRRSPNANGNDDGSTPAARGRSPQDPRPGCHGQRTLARPRWRLPSSVSRNAATASAHILSIPSTIIRGASLACPHRSIVIIFILDIHACIDVGASTTVTACRRRSGTTHTPAPPSSTPFRPVYPSTIYVLHPIEHDGR